MLATKKVHEHMFSNPAVAECNKLLCSCKTKNERIRIAPLIRSKVSLDFISNMLLNRGLVGSII